MAWMMCRFPSTAIRYMDRSSLYMRVWRSFVLKTSEEEILKLLYSPLVHVDVYDHQKRENVYDRFLYLVSFIISIITFLISISVPVKVFLNIFYNPHFW
jgi:hypothetical protein